MNPRQLVLPVLLPALVFCMSLSVPLETQETTASRDGTHPPAFLQKATKRAVERIQGAVVNIRPELNRGLIPSYEKLMEDRAEDRLRNFVEEMQEEGMMNDRHRRALRTLLYRLDDERMYNTFQKKLRRVMSRGATRIRDALDFLQYLAPPRSGFSGVLLKGGYVLTSRFAVSADHIKKINVFTAGGGKVTAEKMGSYGRFDIAILKIRDTGSLPEKAQPVPLAAPTSSPSVGDWAIAVGRGPRPEEITASRGIISANRLLESRSLQTDAFCNYSNTGGALVDIRGRLVGIITGVTLENVLMVGQNSGVTKAIRPGALKNILPDLKEGKAIQSSFLGVQRARDTDPDLGVRVKRVLDGCAAAKGGLKNGDVILSFGGTDIRKWRDLVTQIRRRMPGDEVRIKIKRDGSTQVIKVQLTSRQCTENTN